MMNIKDAITAVRRAGRVFVGVVVFDGADQSYVRTSKREVIAILRANQTLITDDSVRCAIATNGDVYIN